MTRFAGRYRGEKGMTLIELAIAVAIIGVLLALAVAAVRRAKVAGNEASAISSVRAIYKAQFSYAATCGAGNYAASLVILGAKTAKAPYPFLNDDLGSSNTPVHSDYQFRMRPGLDSKPAAPDCSGNVTQNSFFITAAPVADDAGTRSFAVNDRGIVYQRLGSTPPTEPLGPPATPIQ